MEFIGTILKVYDIKSGENENGNWRVCQILVRDNTQMYGQSLLIDVWDAWIDVVAQKIGHVVKCQLDCRVRTYETVDKNGEIVRRDSNNIRLMSALEV